MYRYVSEIFLQRHQEAVHKIELIHPKGLAVCTDLVSLITTKRCYLYVRDILQQLIKNMVRISQCGKIRIFLPLLFCMISKIVI